MKYFNNAKTAGITAVISALSACSGSLSSSREADLSATGKKAKGQIHVFTSDGSGFNTNTVFYDTGSEVVAFDAQFTSELAEKSIAFLREKTQNPIRYLVVTHPNPDKFNGIAVFKKQGAQVVASKATAASMPVAHAYKKYFFVNVAKMFTDDSYPALDTVDVTFDKTLDLKLNGAERIRLEELSGPGVSSNQTVAFIPGANALIVGDLVHHKVHAWLEGGIVNGQPRPEIASWIHQLNEIKASFAEQNPVVYGGRGASGKLNVVVPQQTSYLKTADQIVSTYVSQLGAKKSELATNEGQKHFTNLTKKFEEVFPDYDLGYMIQYSVYGLALSK